LTFDQVLQTLFKKDYISISLDFTDILLFSKTVDATAGFVKGFIYLSFIDFFALD
jgi:hypothetical protein